MERRGFLQHAARCHRSIYLGHVGDCKTESIAQPFLWMIVLRGTLAGGQETSRYRQADDWIFASPGLGQIPILAGCCATESHSTRGSRAGIERKLGGHTFRHTFSTLLIANGENVKVVQD